MSLITAWFASAIARCRCQHPGCPNTATEYDALLDARTCELHTTAVLA